MYGRLKRLRSLRTISNLQMETALFFICREYALAINPPPPVYHNPQSTSPTGSPSHAHLYVPHAMTVRL